MFLPGFAGCDQSQPSSSSSSSLAPFAPFAPFAPLAPAVSTAPATAAAMAAATAPQPALLASPPASPTHMSGPHGLGNLLTSCRNLQALLSAPAPGQPMAMAPLLPITPPQQHQELLPAVAASCPTSPTPVRHQRHQPHTAAAAPMRLRLRPRRIAPAGDVGTPSGEAVARKRIVRRGTGAVARPAALPRLAARGPNKRRREAGDEGGDVADDVDDVEGEYGEEANDGRLDTATGAAPEHPFFLAPSPMRRGLSSPRRSMDRVDAGADALMDTAVSSTTATTSASPCSPPRPQTPKRARIAPAALPLGLERSDFHALYADGVPDDSSSSRHPFLRSDQDNEAAAADGHDDDVWSTEDDRMLVELVLEKLKLSKTEWQECARTLGRRDHHSLGRRWKSLMLHGEIGLRPAVGSAQGARGSRRSRLHGTWR